MHQMIRLLLGKNQQNESVIQNHTIECHERRLLEERNRFVIDTPQSVQHHNQIGKQTHTHSNFWREQKAVSWYIWFQSRYSIRCKHIAVLLTEMKAVEFNKIQTYINQV